MSTRATRGGAAAALCWGGCLAALLSAAPATVRANPLDAFGAGSRAISLGGAFTGLADDTSANYYNPAGLAQGRDLRFDFGYLYANPELRFSGGDAGVDLARGFQGGVALPGEVLGLRFGAGLQLFLLDDRVTRVRSLPQRQPRFVLFDNRIQRLFISANFAVETWEGLFIGGGLTFMANTDGRLNVEGVVSTVDVERTALQAAVDVDIESTRYAQAGILFAPPSRPWSIGLVFRQEFFLRLGIGTLVTGQIVIDEDPDNPIVLVDDGSFVFDSDNANLFSPMQIVIGGSYDFGPVSVTADLGWCRRSEFPAPTSTVSLELDIGNLDFSIPPIDPVQPANFSDLVIPRVGVEVDLFDGDHFDLVGRGGYFFEDTPAPDQPGLTNYADAPKHGLSLGFGLAFSDFTAVLPKPLLLDLGFQMILMQERTYLKDDPADLAGDYRIDGEIFGFSVLMGILL